MSWADSRCLATRRDPQSTHCSDTPWHSYCCYHHSMTARKQRLTVTVDPELVEAGNRAVVNGDADSLSAWVSSALADKICRDQQLEHLQAAITDYEAEFGEITADEIVTQRRADREDAVVIRRRRPRSGARGGRAPA
jgi:ribonuclease HII